MPLVKLSKKQQEIISLLNSTEEVLIQKGLSELKVNGGEEIIPDVLNILINSDNELLTEGLKNILFEIKSQKAVDHIFNILSLEKSVRHRAFLISIFWQAGLDASEYLSTLVELAINNDYLTCLECLTVIENFETEFTEEEIIRNTSILKEAIAKNEDKAPLLASMHEIIQNFLIG